MSSDDSLPNPPPSGQPDPENSQNPPIRARVPDHVAGGIFSTGAIVVTGPTEFIVDFLQTVGRPHRVAARIIVPHQVMPQFVQALQTNLDLYRNRFGDPVVPQTQQPNPEARRPSPQEIYDDLKMADEVLSGTYANGVMIGHGATEFGLDFLTSFFPQSAVSARVFVASGQVPRLLDSLKGAVRQLEQRRQSQGATEQGATEQGGMAVGGGPAANNDPPGDGESSPADAGGPGSSPSADSSQDESQGRSDSGPSESGPPQDGSGPDDDQPQG